MHSEQEERRELAMLPLSDPTPGVVCHIYGIATGQSKRSPEREVGEGIRSSVSTGLWESYTVLGVQNTEKNNKNSPNEILKVIL